jgi:hypothetical protein
MNQATASCETIGLKNGSMLYWQYNCKRIWLTLENKRGRKTVINEVPVDFYGYTYRLGYHLIKEYRHDLLFRHGCGATGPCSYSLVNNTSGKTVRSFNQLIQIDTDSLIKDPHPYEFDFVVYRSKGGKGLEIFYVDTGKGLKIPVEIEDNEKDWLFGDPFKKMTLQGDLLNLIYQTTRGREKNLRIDLKSGKYSMRSIGLFRPVF